MLLELLKLLLLLLQLLSVGWLVQLGEVKKRYVHLAATSRTLILVLRLLMMFELMGGARCGHRALAVLDHSLMFTGCHGYRHELLL